MENSHLSGDEHDHDYELATTGGGYQADDLATEERAAFMLDGSIDIRGDSDSTTTFSC